VLETRADIGIALDGDADRIVIVDENGEVIDGDKLIGALAVHLKNKNKLSSTSVIATVMSNQGLEEYLGQNGLTLERSDVGDKHVLSVMKKVGANFGGEQSGHVIFSDVAKTGDGLASALQVLAMILQSGKPASEILNPFDIYPQILKNLKVEEKIPLNEIKGLNELLKNIKDKGIRDLIRYSGTENKLRVLLEGKNDNEIKKSMDELISFLRKSL
jgi:phosphoglucosamine mutase